MKTKPAVKVFWEMAAWSETSSLHRRGAPFVWSTYEFDTLQKALKTRARLERQWSAEHWKSAWGERADTGHYTFDIYRVERKLVPRATPSDGDARRGR